MEARHLYSAADVRIGMKMSGSLKQAEAAVKKNYGLDNPRSKQTLLSEQLLNLIAKAEKDSKSFFKSDSSGKDPINSFLAVNSGNKIESNRIHPMDEAFNMITAAVEIENKEVAAFKEKKAKLDLDPINEYVQQAYGELGNQNEPNYKIGKVYNSIEKIFSSRVSGGKSNRNIDPAQQVVINGMGDGYFPSNPVHTLAEWNSLIETATGKNVNEVINTLSVDIEKEQAAASMGMDSPAGKKLSMVQSDLMQATYLLAYKLKPGTAAFNKKSSEVILLKNKRKYLQEVIEKASV